MNAQTVYSRLTETARRLGDAPFLHVLEETAAVYGIPAGDISYREMLARADRRAESLQAAGYGAGQRVGLLVENRPVFLEIWFALNRLGMSVVPINPDLRLSELAYQAGHSEMVLAIVLPERADEMRAAALQAGLELAIATPDEAPPQSPTPPPTTVVPGSHTECALLYTSGTTGKPKGCVASNEYFLNCGDWYAAAGGLIALERDRERMLTPLPLFHMNAMAASTLGMVTVGGCLILLDRFHPRSWWQSVRESRASIIHYLGVMPAMLMGAPASAADRDHSIRFGFGAGVDPKLHAAFEERFGFPLIEAWACTETGNGAVICANREPREVGTSCFGRPSAEVEVRIVDEAGTDLYDEAPGELLVRRAGANPSYGFFSGYLKEPKATEEVWSGGWFHTGDLVSRAQDGALRFVDRKKNLIRRSGENIAALEVEAVFNQHPDIRTTAVAAVPDAVRGDEVAALIVLNDGPATADRAAEIVRWGLDQMAYYKVPGWIAFVQSLPLTATQKILRGELKDLVKATMENNGFFDTRGQKKRSR